jgi:putative spermidine/putrescine transport system permease protein
MTKGLGRVAPVLLVLTVAPIIVGLTYSVGGALGVLGPGAAGASMSRVTHALGSGETWRSLGWTLMVAGVATLAAMIAAVSVAARLWDSAMGRRLALVPLAVPHLAAALGVLLLLGQSGLLSRLAFGGGLIANPAQFPAIVYDQLGVGLAVSFFWKEFPFLALTAFAVRASLPPAWLEAAKSLGATSRQVHAAVIRPLLVRGITPAAISVFAYLVGQYEMATLLGPSTPPALAVLTYERITDPMTEHRGEAYVLAVLAMLLSFVLVGAYAMTRNRLADDA